MLSKILTARRKALGMSIDELAKKSGIPKSTVAKIMSGINENPKLDAVKALAYALGLSLNEIGESVESSVTEEEYSIIRQMRSLDAHGWEIVKYIVDAEYRRCKGSGSITTAVQHAVRNGETEDSIAMVITLYSRAGEDARSKALDVLADDDGRGFKAENDAVLGRHVGQIIGKDTNAANVE